MRDKKSNDSRRKLLKSIVAGSGVVVAGKSLPEAWTKPIVDSVMLPAHASTTQECGPFCGELKDGEEVYAFAELIISGTTVNLRACHNGFESTGSGPLNDGSFNFLTSANTWLSGTIKNDCSGATVKFCADEAGSQCNDNFSLSPGTCGTCID